MSTGSFVVASESDPHRLNAVGEHITVLACASTAPRRSPIIGSPMAAPEMVTSPPGQDP